MLKFNYLIPFILYFIMFSMTFMFGLMSLIIDITTEITIIHPIIAIVIIIGSTGLVATAFSGLKDVFKTYEKINKNK